MSHNDDGNRPQLRPIPGAPIGAPNPQFPGGKPEPRLEPKEPEPEQVRPPDSIPGPNEIAARLEDLKKHKRYADKLGLETHCEIGKLLVIMVDVHKYEGKQYESFAIAHGAGNRSDAYALYRLGLVADDVILKCEAEERIDPGYQYPHWRKMVPKKPEDEKEASKEDDEPDEPDPVAELQRERDNLEAQVKAATQQYRNERAKREEVEEDRQKLKAAVTLLRDQIATLREQMVARDAEIAALKQYRDEPPLTGRQTVLQTVAKLLRGRFHQVRISGTQDKLEIAGSMIVISHGCASSPYCHHTQTFRATSTSNSSKARAARRSPTC